MRNAIKILAGAAVLATFITITEQDTLAKKNAVDTEAMTAAHNKWRSELGIPDLKWSTQLADVAQKWADHLAGNSCTNMHSGSGFGENLFWASPITSSDGSIRQQDITGQNVVETWADEAKDYRYADNSCKDVCGNYTQVVWKTTTEVGCGMAICSNNAQIWVCNYSPAGNVVGRRPY